MDILLAKPKEQAMGGCVINRPAATMTNQALARIRWLSAVEGGRKAIPVGPNYTTVARFRRQGSDWTTMLGVLLLNSSAQSTAT
jgi:hypothetical protein